MSKTQYKCWKCGKAKKAGQMSGNRTHCKKCVKNAPMGVKSQVAFLTKSFGAKPKPVVLKAARPPVTRAAGGSPQMVTKAWHNGMLPASAPGPVPWDPEKREQHRAATPPGTSEQQQVVAAQLMAKAAGTTISRWREQSDATLRELMYAAAVATGQTGRVQR